MAWFPGIAKGQTYTRAALTGDLPRPFHIAATQRYLTMTPALLQEIGPTL
jgi:hypothetical protein